MDLSFKKTGSTRHLGGLSISSRLKRVIDTKKNTPLVTAKRAMSSLSSFTSHKMKELKKYTSGARLLEKVRNTTPQDILAPHSLQVMPTRFEVAETLADHIRAEIIRPNHRAFLSAALLLLVVVFSTAFLRGDIFSGQPLQQQTFAREQKMKTSDDSSVAGENRQYSVNEIVDIHKKIISSLVVKEKGGSYLLPKPDASKPVFLELKELGKTIDLDMENKQESPGFRFYDFAGVPGDNAKTIMLSLSKDIDATLLKLSPGSKMVLTGQDKAGVSYTWTYSMTARNQTQLDDRSVFTASSKSNLGFLVYSGENTMQVIDARLVSVDKVAQ